MEEWSERASAERNTRRMIGSLEIGLKAQEAHRVCFPRVDNDV